jgi:hypothetical protein
MNPRWAEVIEHELQRRYTMSMEKVQIFRHPLRLSAASVGVIPPASRFSIPSTYGVHLITERDRMSA